MNYGNARDTIDCLDSVRSLETPVDTIVVDNGSKDDSVDKIRGAHPSVEIVVNDANRGFAGGCNVALERFVERGLEFVWLLNNDATVEPQSLAAMLEVADRDHRVGQVGSVIYERGCRDHVKTWGGGAVSRWTARTRDATTASDRVDYITAASALIRSQALRQIGGLDERFFFLWEDADLSLRLKSADWRLAVADSSAVSHIGGGTTPHLSSFRIEHHTAGSVVFGRKHSPISWLSSMPLLGYYALRALRDRNGTTWASAWRGWRRGWSS